MANLVGKIEVSNLIQMVDRPNTTPIGQDRTSQWRNVLFDPYLFEAQPR